MTSRHTVRDAASTSFLICLLTASLAACGGPALYAGAGGPVPLDSTRAVALAERNVCGRVMPAADTTCSVRAVQQDDGQFLVTLDRHPPAGNDRVVVTLRHNGSSINVEPVDSTVRSPSR
jgi:hypothetical protein